MNNNFSDINKIIAKILSKEASSEDILIFSEWVNKDSKNKKEFQVLIEFWNVKSDEEVFLAELSFEKNKDRFFEEESKLEVHLIDRKKKYRTFMFSIAAVLLLLLSVGSLLFILRQDSKDHFIYLAQNEITYITLPDGSEVVLNKNSKLSYSSDFMTKNRTVHLEGEGYFEVKYLSTHKKFIVEVGNSQVEVIGTKFNINAYELNECVKATLIEGSILFKNGKQQILMEPDQQLTFYTQSNLIENKKIRTDRDIAWKDKLYRYYSIPLAELTDDLAKNYGVEFIVNDNLKDIKVSGSFFQDQNIEEVLRIMQNSIGCKWKRQNDKIIIY